jgi:hypothetical protein
LSATEIKISTGYRSREAFKPFHRRKERFAVLVCHRRAGKTVATINDLIDSAIRCELPAPRYAYIAPLYAQAKNIAWDYLKRFTDPIHGRQVNESELRVDLPGDRRIRLFGADNPDSLRGLYFDGVALDEPAQMKPAMWEEVIRPALADRNGFAIFIGTPKGRNWFYDRYRKAEKDPTWFTMRLKASESGILDEDEMADMTKDMSPALTAQEMECAFDAPNSVQFIPNELVDTALDRYIPRSTAARVMGVDVARFGNDRSVILVRTDILEYVRIFRGIDTQQLAAMVAEEAATYRPRAIFVDGNGVGGGVVDRLRALGNTVFDVQAGGKANASDRYANKRAEMWGNMREWLKERGSIPPDTVGIDELADDLVSPQYKYDRDNRIILESKDDMKARGIPSPDLGDALGLTFAEPVSAPELDDVRRRNVKHQIDYDPFANLYGERR